MLLCDFERIWHKTEWVGKGKKHQGLEEVDNPRPEEGEEEEDVDEEDSDDDDEAPLPAAAAAPAKRRKVQE